MSKAATTYWDENNSVAFPRLNSRSRTQSRSKAGREAATPQWFAFAVVVLITFMLCMTINLRAFSELNTEIQENQQLSTEVDQLTNRNLVLQEEIHNLKNDPKVIEREARKLGMGRPNEKIFVPAN